MDAVERLTRVDFAALAAHHMAVADVLTAVDIFKAVLIGADVLGASPTQQWPTSIDQGSSSGCGSGPAEAAAKAANIVSIANLQSANEAEDQSEQGELQRVIAAVDQPQAERAPLEQIIDPERGRDPAQTG